MTALLVVCILILVAMASYSLWLRFRSAHDTRLWDAWWIPGVMIISAILVGGLIAWLASRRAQAPVNITIPRATQIERTTTVRTVTQTKTRTRTLTRTVRQQKHR
jgi:hypothetical protein